MRRIESGLNKQKPLRREWERLLHSLARWCTLPLDGEGVLKAFDAGFQIFYAPLLLLYEAIGSLLHAPSW